MNLQQFLSQLQTVTEPIQQIGLTIEDGKSDMSDVEERCLVLRGELEKLTEEGLVGVQRILFDTLKRYDELRKSSEQTQEMLSKVGGTLAGSSQKRTPTQILADVTNIMEQAKQQNLIRLLAEMLQRTNTLLDQKNN